MSARRFLCLGAITVTLGWMSCGGDGGGGKKKVGEFCANDQECETGLCVSSVCLDPDGDDDLDGLRNGIEKVLNLDPLNRDSDGDGVADGQEVISVQKPADMDGDGSIDARESGLPQADPDHDCLPDQYDPHNAVADTEVSPALLGEVCARTGVCLANEGLVLGYCNAGVLSCDFSAVPGYEVNEATCDVMDNDCDGQTDEGLTGCVTVASCDQPECTLDLGSGTGQPFDVTARHSGVGVDQDGNLVIDVTTIELPYLWIANDQDETISKVDSRSGREVARYSVGPECSSPSRTSVDLDGNVHIGCREGSMGTRLVKIAADPVFCVDKNGNGVVDTMTWQTDPETGVRTPVMPPWQDDECVLFNGAPAVPETGATDDILANPVPTDCNATLRGVAATKDRTVVIGGNRGCRDGHYWEVRYRYDPTQPYLENVNPGMEVVGHWYLPDLEHTDPWGRECADPGDTGSYGLAIDQKGIVWIASLDNSNLSMLDRKNRRSCRWDTGTPYGISVDYAGRVWLGSWTGDDAIGRVFLPETATFFEITQNLNGEPWNAGTNLSISQLTRGAAGSSNPSNPRGYLALTEGAAGVVTVRVLSEASDSFDARVESVVRTDSNAVCEYGGSSSGVGLDGHGDIWVIHMDDCGHSMLDDRDHFNAVAIELDAAKLKGFVNPTQPAEAASVVKSLVDTGSHSYTYSDFIGQQLATIVAPQGTYEQVFQGWNEPGVTTEWVYLEATLVKPMAGSALFASYRVADTLWALSSTEMSAEAPIPCEGTDCKLTFPASTDGRFLDVRVVLKTDSQGQSPEVSGLKIALKKKAVATPSGP